MVEDSTKSELNRKGDTRGLHPNSLANLKAGPGRPRNELSITHIAREMLSQVCPFDAEKRTWAQYLAYRLLSQSVDNITSLKELLERLEGKILTPIGVEGDTKVTFTIGKGYDNGSQTQSEPNK